MGDARPPRKVAKISVFNGAATGSFCWRNAGAGGSTTLCMWFKGDSPMVEKFQLATRACSGIQLLVWRIIGDDDATRWPTFSSSPRWWWCSVVLCAFVCVGCTRQHVMYQPFVILPLYRITCYCWLLITMIIRLIQKHWCKYAKRKLYLKYLWWWSKLQTKQMMYA
jgi:hypothetical protein